MMQVATEAAVPLPTPPDVSVLELGLDEYWATAPTEDMVPEEDDELPEDLDEEVEDLDADDQDTEPLQYEPPAAAHFPRVPVRHTISHTAIAAGVAPPPAIPARAVLVPAGGPVGPDGVPRPPKRLNEAALAAAAAAARMNTCPNPAHSNGCTNGPHCKCPAYGEYCNHGPGGCTSTQNVKWRKFCNACLSAKRKLKKEEVGSEEDGAHVAKKRLIPATGRASSCPNPLHVTGCTEGPHCKCPGYTRCRHGPGECVSTQNVKWRKFCNSCLTAKRHDLTEMSSGSSVTGSDSGDITSVSTPSPTSVIVGHTSAAAPPSRAPGAYAGAPYASATGGVPVFPSDEELVELLRTGYDSLHTPGTSPVDSIATSAVDHRHSDSDATPMATLQLYTPMNPILEEGDNVPMAVDVDFDFQWRERRTSSADHAPIPPPRKTAPGLSPILAPGAAPSSPTTAVQSPKPAVGGASAVSASTPIAAAAPPVLNMPPPVLPPPGVSSGSLALPPAPPVLGAARSSTLSTSSRGAETPSRASSVLSTSSRPASETAPHTTVVVKPPVDAPQSRLITPAPNGQPMYGSRKSLPVAYALWVFGFLGLHHFYLRRHALGFCYMFTFGLFGIGWLADFNRMPALVAAANASDPMQDRLVTEMRIVDIRLTAIMFGFAGLHYVLLRRYRWAALYFFTFGLLGMGWLTDILRAPALVEAENDGWVHPLGRSATAAAARRLQIETTNMRLLAGPLGFLGLHRFYLGQPGWGFAHIFTFGFLGLGWFIEWCRAPEHAANKIDLDAGHGRPHAYVTGDVLVLMPMGFMGVHHFYMRRPKWGFLYLCTFGLLGIGWIADLLFLSSVVHRVNEARGGPIAPNRYEAYLLGGPLGFLGLHRFYLGYTTSGYLYLCTFGLFGLGWLADLLLLMPRLVDDACPRGRAASLMAGLNFAGIAEAIPVGFSVVTHAQDTELATTGQYTSPTLSVQPKPVGGATGTSVNDPSHVARCAVCVENPACTIMVPCGHNALCATCNSAVATMKECPVCHNHFSDIKVIDTVM